MLYRRNLLLTICLLLLSQALTSNSFAQTEVTETKATETKTKADKPKIAIIIDDLGHKKKEGKQAIDLGIPLAVAVLPKTPHGKSLAEYAKQKDAEVMLHLPMQPSASARLMTPHTLSINMDETQFKLVVQESLQDIPYVQGVNNHMGSLFTQLPAQMGWLMQTLQEQNQSMFFVDSFTSERSIAYQVAAEYAIPNTKRDVFLDRQLDAKHMEAQITRLKRVARKNGEVVVIGHPFKETIALLEKHIPELKKQGFEFVKVSSLVNVPSQKHAASDTESNDKQNDKNTNL